jgi:hypothetical protein
VASEQKRNGASRSWRGWIAAAAIPTVGVLELGAHFVQTCAVVPERDWTAARVYLAAQARPEDLVAFAPRWADPLGREYFGAAVATLDREARNDESRFPRSFEVSIRGAHLGSLASWQRVAEKRFGGVLVTTWQNPSWSPVLADLVTMVTPERLEVRMVQGGREAACVFGNGAVMSGGLGAGQPVPAERFACPGGTVSKSLATDLDYYPHQCIYAAAPGGGGVVRLRFIAVELGRWLRGHHGIYVEAETAPSGQPPVVITFRVNDQVIGQAGHREGEGWTHFQFDTSSLAGVRADVVVEIGTAGGERRQYCFEANTL